MGIAPVQIQAQNFQIGGRKVFKISTDRKTCQKFEKMAAVKALKRRSSIHHNVSVTDFDDESFVDEESERKNRLKLKKRQSIVNVQTPIHPPTSSISKCSQAELAKMYADCIKLSAENKISAKNAFNLNLIDYMAEVVKTKKSSEMDNFQSASCALDASTKIYAHRVDSVMILKVLK